MSPIFASKSCLKQEQLWQADENEVKKESLEKRVKND